MAAFTSPTPIASDGLDLYQARDPLLANCPILILYGPSTTVNSTSNSSRIQAHVFSPAGYQYFPRLTIAPTSPVYAAVHHLPSDIQGDEVSRGLAVTLLSYFSTIPVNTRSSLQVLARGNRHHGAIPKMFDEMHAADLAAKMEPMANKAEITTYLNRAISSQTVSWLDVDVIFPQDSIHRVRTSVTGEDNQAFDDAGLPLYDFGAWDFFAKALGTPTFLPTSKLRRAPSRPPPQSRSRVLSKEGKIALRREMCELVDTENNYVSKIDELVNDIAATCRSAGRATELDQLFPPSLDEILDLSKQFYEATQASLEATEDDAIRDIESSQPVNTTANDACHSKDPTGATLLAEILTNWFPKFHEPYQSYLRASSSFGDSIGHCLNDSSSPSARILNQIGEQRLRSALIEPVQRLPRYSLLIDNIVNLLPGSHSSLPLLLKARDVIKDICALDRSGQDHTSQANKVLCNLVVNWSHFPSPKGRFIAAIDGIEVQPPFTSTQAGKAGILLLFADRLMLLRKPDENGLTARGIVAEIDRPSLTTQLGASLTAKPEKNLRVSASLGLSRLGLRESHDGNIVHIAELLGDSDIVSAVYGDHPSILRSYYLLGPYEKKVGRFSHEIALARIEGRFTDVVRDGGRWSLRSVNGENDHNFALSLFDVGVLSEPNYVLSPATIRVILEDASVSPKARNLHTIGITAYIKPVNSETYQVEVLAKGEDSRITTCLASDLAHTLRGHVLQAYQQHYQTSIEQAMFFTQILRGLPSDSETRQASLRVHRPRSPVKMLSKILGGQGSQPSTPSKTQSGNKLTKAVPLLPTPSHLTKAEIIQASQSEHHLGRKGTVLNAEEEAWKSPLALLEDTLIAYVIGLRSQSGNAVGKALRNRSAADELTVNEVYNTLLEDPTRVEMAASVPIDVVFAAFEKFLRRAWRERMGPLVPPSTLQRMQTIMETKRGVEFSQEFKSILGEMSPQNRRAFASTIKLLSDLLDASGNDGDRGILIASFSEAIVLVGNPHDYITLVDRLVEDYDNLFDEVIERAGSSGSATSSASRNRSYDKGSYGSHSSSFRKRFGFGAGLSRENSKNESESKISSLLRTWSKTSKGQGDSTDHLVTPSKISLVRSKSTDVNPRTLIGPNGLAQERPTTSGSINSVESSSRPGSSQAEKHLKAFNVTSSGQASLPRKKRRSSLSDLGKIQDLDRPDLRSPLHPRNPNATDSVSPLKRERNAVYDSTTRRENSPPKIGSYATGKALPEQPHTAKSNDLRPQSIIITSHGSPQPSTSQKATVRSALSERSWPPNATLPSSKQESSGSPQKLRVQSPKKLRERLAQEQQAISASSNGLQAEIDQISKEMSSLRVGPHQMGSSNHGDTIITLSSLSSRIDILSKSLEGFKIQQSSASDSLRHELEQTVGVADKRARKLEELYKEANAENEALYERFNEELGKVLAKIKKGDGIEEMRRRLTDALGEVGTLRAEKAKLKKEVLELQSRIPD